MINLWTRCCFVMAHLPINSEESNSPLVSNSVPRALFQDVYSLFASPKKKSNALAVAVGVAVGVIVAVGLLVSVCVAVVFAKRRRAMRYFFLLFSV